MNYCHRLVVVISLVVVAFVTDAEVGTINIPSNYSTIQEAINAATNNDEVIVAASGGPYFENITFNNRAITAKTTDGVVIDGKGNG